MDAITPYVTNLNSNVYCLRHLPEEVVAVLFAYYSRSTGSLRENLAKLLSDREVALGTRLAADGDDELARAREQAAKFHEKWVVGYGHASVAEHAIAHVAVEEISILASKVLEDTRLASYTEKSTRYVTFDEHSFHTPRELDDVPDLKQRYQQTARRLMRLYSELSERVLEQVRAAYPNLDGTSPRLYDSRTKAKACDLCRYVLPACTNTNVGVTLNGRLAEHMITKLLSHPLAEVRELGAKIKQEVVQVLPTLVKYADFNPHQALRGKRVATALAAAGVSDNAELGDPPPAAEPQPAGNVVRLVAAPTDPMAILAAGILLEHANMNMDQATAAVARLDGAARLAIVDAYLADRGPHDQPGRALELLTYTFDIVCDYGAFRDIQRHRMATQINQPLTCTLGYTIPAELVEFGHEVRVREALHEAAQTYHAVRQFDREVASYIVPLAYRKRTVFAWNLRSLWHFIRLRSTRQGHASYRDIAQQCWRELSRVSPSIAQRVPVDMEDYTLGRTGKETVTNASTSRIQE